MAGAAELWTGYANQAQTRAASESRLAAKRAGRWPFAPEGCGRPVRTSRGSAPDRATPAAAASPRATISDWGATERFEASTRFEASAKISRGRSPGFRCSSLLAGRRRGTGLRCCQRGLTFGRTAQRYCRHRGRAAGQRRPACPQGCSASAQQTLPLPWLARGPGPCGACAKCLADRAVASWSDRPGASPTKVTSACGLALSNGSRRW